MSVNPDDGSNVAKELLDRFASAWNGGDAEVLASIFEPEATFVDVTAKLSDGRAAILQLHAAGFSGALGGTKIDFSRIDVRKLRTDAILALAFWKVSSNAAQNVDQAESRTGLLSLILCHSWAGWSVVAAHNTPAMTLTPIQPLS